MPVPLEPMQAHFQSLSLRDAGGRASHDRPPSVEELESAPPSQPTVPPLPKFSASLGQRRAVQVIVDGQPQEGFVDSSGRIQLSGTVHYSIGSDQEDEPTTDNTRLHRRQADPFAPGAASPFREVTTAAEASNEMGRPVPPPPPPPPGIEGWSRGARRRTPSPGTPNAKRGGWSHCNDWLHRIQPSINDLAPKAYVWWGYVMKETKDSYKKRCAAGPLERTTERRA